jgi:diguanylate cyclase (GGDEF)-like protein
MANEYILEEHFVKNNLVINQTIFQESLTEAAWDFNKNQLATIADGIMKQRTIVGIEIHTEEGYLLQKGKILNQNKQAISLENNSHNPLFYIELFPHHFNLTHNKKTIGKVTLYSSSHVVFDKVKYNFITIIINAIIKTIALWLLFFWAFNKFLTRQLDVFCQTMEKIDLDNQKNYFLNLETFNTYELSRIEYFFNDLLKRIIENRDKLSELNKTLEEKVIERTQQLFQKQQDLEKLNTELEQQLNIIEILSITDELTQLYNRRYFNTIFPKEIHRAARENIEISFLIFDVDYFKQYNDNYGHQNGDKVLRTIGKTLTAQCHRGSDIALRLGGEEFGVIFSGLNSTEAFVFADKIRQAIVDIQIEHRFNCVADYITASFGVVTVRAHPDLLMDELYKKADDALYQAKDSGRNKIVQAE